MNEGPSFAEDLAERLREMSSYDPAWCEPGDVFERELMPPGSGQAYVFEVVADGVLYEVAVTRKAGEWAAAHPDDPDVKTAIAEEALDAGD